MLGKKHKPEEIIGKLNRHSIELPLDGFAILPLAPQHHTRYR
jgi:hypothetical protein